MSDIVISRLFWVIEEYGDNDPPEPWGYYQHPGLDSPIVGEVIMLKTLDERDHHKVTVTRIDGSELRVRL